MATPQRSEEENKLLKVATRHGKQRQRAPGSQELTLKE